MKKNKGKSFPKGTNFGTKHDPLIRGGEESVTKGWVNAAVECVDKFGGNASAYARASVNGFTVSQKENTIRQYVGDIVKGIKHYKGSVKEMLAEYDIVYETREISALRNFLSGVGQRKKGKDKRRSSNAVALTKRSARRAWDNAKSFDEFWELVSE